MGGPAGLVKRLVEIERGANSTEAQFFLDLEERTNFYFSLAFTALTLIAFVLIGRRLGV